MEIKVYRMENLELKFASKEEIKVLNDMRFKGKCEYLFTINNEKNLYFKISDLLYEIYSRKINSDLELEEICLFLNIPFEYQEKMKDYMNVIKFKDFYYSEAIKLQTEFLIVLEEIREKEKNMTMYLFRKIEDNSLVYSNNKKENGKLLVKFDLTKPLPQRALEVLNLITTEHISKNQLNKICKRLELDESSKVLLRTINNSLLEKEEK